MNIYLVPEKNASEDNGVENPDQGDAEHDPERDEGHLPRPVQNSRHNIEIVFSIGRYYPCQNLFASKYFSQ